MHLLYYFCVSVIGFSYAFLGGGGGARRIRCCTMNTDYPISRHYYENALKRLHSLNRTIADHEFLGNNIDETSWVEKVGESLIIIHHREISTNHTQFIHDDDESVDEAAAAAADETPQFSFQKMLEQIKTQRYQNAEENKDDTSEHFEVMYNISMRFDDVGGFQTIKQELLQCIDMLKNWEKYAKYSVRTSKGCILEGPPGNGKTMIARAFAGEANVAFIAVAGSEFQDKYIGVGSSKVRELFHLAYKNRPCIIFIDEIDAIGRRRSDGVDAGAGAERDNTLNQLLVEMDGFKNNSGIFVIGATNRADLLDSALIRPGRIDKRIYVGMPDTSARRRIIDIHIRGKPHSLTHDMMNELVSMTAGFSGAQIENILNEAMLFALLSKREMFDMNDIIRIYNTIMSGMQSEEHVMNDEMLERICVHEIGHAFMSLHCKHHPPMKKVVIHLRSPRNPGMTLFEEDENILSTRESLFERLAILYSGQIAESLIYGAEFISNGAISDYEEARKLAQKMIIEYGMGGRYSGISEKSNEKIDIEVEKLLSNAYSLALGILQKNKDSIISGSHILKRDLSITYNDFVSYLM